MFNFFLNIKRSSWLERLIFLIIIVYVTALFAPYIPVQWLSLSVNYDTYIIKPWTFLTYGIVHLNFIHLLANLLILFYIGSIFNDFFSDKSFILYFVFGTLIGGIFFEFYYLINKMPSISHLLGASAGISAIFLGLTVRVPHYPVKIRFIGSVELWVLAVIWIVLSILAIGEINAGSAVAHLGGGIAGFIFTYLFGYKIKPKRKIIKLNKNEFNHKIGYRKKKIINDEVDRILDKINKNGYENLTIEEKEFLKDSKNVNHP